MCGIAGFVRKKDSGGDSSGLLTRMTGRIAHRGPDGQGAWIAPGGKWETALGHRRLSIIDLEGGRQPLGNEDGSVQISFNGEIYNFQKLRAELEGRGHRFATRSDTEVIVHHFEEKGTGGFGDLNGMFAFAIWDAKAGTLTLARDRAGIKPLYYATLPDGSLAFASELGALLEFPGLGRALSVPALRSFFFSDSVLAPGTILEGVRKLEPGHWVRWQDGKLTEPAAFWSFGETPEAPRYANDREGAEDLLRRLQAAVERQMIADVPVGVFLSGGIDSSMVAALAQRISPRPLQTFSIAFDDPSFDESAYARMVARHIGSDHTEETLTEKLLLDTVDAALGALDEPMADPSIVPTWLLSRLAARHVKVALGGDGGDELLAGYPTYKAAKMAGAYGALPALVRNGLIRPIVSSLPVNDRYQSFEWKAKRFAERFDSDPFVRHLRWMSNTDLADLGRAIPGESLPATLSYRSHLGLPEGDVLNRLLALDFGTYMVSSVLTKVDRASMAHGLEVRPPLLDNEMIAWAFSLPSSYKLRGSTGKYLFKLASESLIPREIAHRPKKGFAIPLATWLRGPLRPRVEEALKSSPLWNVGAVRRETFVDWNREHQERKRDWSRTLWALVVLDHWMRRIA